MATIYISLGSNIDRDKNTRAGVQALQDAFGELQLSSVYESESVGFEGDAFYNMVIACETVDDVFTTNSLLSVIEDEHGRDRSGPRFSSRTLDLDMLLYDDLVIEQGKLILPRDEILKNAFVLWPLAELAPDMHHPVVGKSYSELWSDFDKSKESLHPIDFTF